MVRRSVVTALCVLFLFSLVACKPKADEPADPVLVAANRIIIEKCLGMKVSCVGGFVKFRDGQISRIELGEPREFRTIGTRNFEVMLNFWDLDRFEFVLPDNPEWEKTAIAYAKQFVERRRE